MKKFLLGSLALLITFGILSSRELVAAFIPSGATKGIQNTPLARQVQATQRPAATATATVDNIATLAVMGTQLTSAEEIARQRQLEVDAMNRMMVEATVTHEFVVLQQAQMIQASEIQKSQATQLSNSMTQTAVPTAIPLTMTAQVNKDNMKKAEMTQTAGEAERIKKEADAEAYADNAGWLVFVKGLLEFALSSMLIALAGLLLAIAFVRVKKAGEPSAPVAEIPNMAETEKRKEFRTIASPDGSHQEKKIYYNIPCTLDELLVLCEGICLEHKTLAIDQWEKTDVHKRMADNSIRLWAINNGFAVPIPHKRGELMIVAAGEQFFTDTLSRVEPPDGFTCLPPSPTE